MRQPNPPSVQLGELDQEQQRKVIRLALLVVGYLTISDDYAALELIQFTDMTVEEKLGFWSLLDSEQRSTIKSLIEAAK